MRELLEQLYAGLPTELEQLLAHQLLPEFTERNAPAARTPESRVHVAPNAHPEVPASGSEPDRKDDATENGVEEMNSLISARDMRIIEDVLQMGSGYVLNFSDRTMREFFADEFHIDIDAEKYRTGGDSKAKRLRTFLRVTAPPLLGRVLGKLLEHRLLYDTAISPEVLAHYRGIAARLGDGGSPTPRGPEVIGSAPLLVVRPEMMPPIPDTGVSTSPPRASTNGFDAVPTAQAKVQVLFVSANPDKNNPLDVEKEENRIVRVRNGSKNKDRIAIEALPDADQLALTDSLRLQSPTIVHFSGHGETDGSLVMRDEEGATYEMHPEGVAKLIALDKGTIRLVVLNACYSSELARRLVNDIDCVVGMNDAVSDDAAILFARVFYSALFDGATIARAFATSAANLEMKYHDEANVPVMICRPGIDPERMRLF